MTRTLNKLQTQVKTVISLYMYNYDYLNGYWRRTEVRAYYGMGIYFS